ncbi:MAG TPA: DUF4097 family beta strand repeat-containing protein [Vicinamibacterales bacterium]|jgi:hypothetical protein|nr:DUF4097 family beta strand repeat-containing protein [Vicinamibacterales bacterium]
MRIAAAVTALLVAAVIAGATPAESGQRGGVEARHEEIQRRREALRQRQELLRRARQDARRGPMASAPFTALAKIGRQGSFTLFNLAGNVTITASGGTDVRIDAVKRVWDRTEGDAKGRLSEIEIEVSERQGAVDVRTVVQRPRRPDAEVDFTIAVPAEASVSVRTGSGDVTVTGIRGELRVEAVGGGIKATSVGQVRLLRTLAGAITLENADGTDMTVSTLGGTVTIRQLKARSADIRTVAGDLIISDSDAERVIAQSLNGRVELAGRLARTGRYSLQSQSGEVRLIPADGDFELEAATVNGSLRSDFPITADDRRELTGPRGRGAALGHGTGRAGRGLGRSDRGNARLLRGLSGNGGPLVTLRSFSGDITITKR